MSAVTKIHYGDIVGQFDSMEILCGGKGKAVTKFDAVSFWELDSKVRCKKCEKKLKEGK